MNNRWETAKSKRPFHKRRNDTYNYLSQPYVPRYSSKDTKPYQKSYAYPAPKQPSCVLTAGGIGKLCENMWKMNDFTKFLRLLDTVKMIRKSIMHLGYDDADLKIDMEIIREIESLNVEGTTKQVLPTSSRLFDSNIWYYMYRAMLPTISFQKSKESFNIISIIYNNLLETYLTSSYERYKSEANVQFQKSIRSNHIKKNERSILSNMYRVMSYGVSFGQYKKIKAECLKKYYENIQNICSLHDVSRLSTLMNNIWAMFSLNIGYKYPSDNAKCIEKYNTLRNEFFTKHSGFSVESCQPATYDEWLQIYSELRTLYLRTIFNDNQIMERDFAFIQDMEKAIKYSVYTKFTDDPMCYKRIGLLPPKTDNEIISAINKLNTTNFETYKYTFNIYSDDDIVRHIFEMHPTKKFVPVYMKLFEFLKIDEKIVEHYLQELNIKAEPEDGVEVMKSEALIAGLYAAEYIHKIEEIIELFDKVSIPEVLLCIKEFKTMIPPSRWVSTSKELLKYAKEYYAKIEGMYKWRLMDIIEELDTKPKVVINNTSSSTETKRKIEPLEGANEYDLLAD